MASRPCYGRRRAGSSTAIVDYVRGRRERESRDSDGGSDGDAMHGAAGSPVVKATAAASVRVSGR